MTEGVLLFGASHGTGLEVAKILAGRGEQLTAVVRPTTDPGALRQLGIRLVTGNSLHAPEVEAAFSSDRFRAVIDTVGGKRGEPRPDFVGTRNIVDAAAKAAVRRYIFVTAIGSGDSRAAVGPKVIEFLGAVLAEKTRGENYLIASGLDYTILRPGGMNNDPASGTAIKTEDHSVMGVINRADLARLVVDCLDDAGTIGCIYHTIDPAILRQAPLQRGDDLPGGPLRS